MSTAKAAVMTGVNTPFEIHEYELVPPPQGMAKLKLIASGVCGTDIHIHRGKSPVKTPIIIGHESGKVIELSDEDSKQYNVTPGDNVIVYIASPCGECPLCAAGDDANCVRMGLTNSGDPSVPPHFFGGYDEYNYSPVKNPIKIPGELDPVTVSIFLCAGPTVLHAFRLAGRANCRIEKSGTAVVQGLGPVGLFAVVYLSSLGIKNIIAVTGSYNAKREELAKKLGATEVYSLDRDGMDTITRHVIQASEGLGADLVFEASGNPKAVGQGLGLLRNRGVYLIPGQYSDSGTAEIMPQLITFKALQIIGSSQYSVIDIEDYLKFLCTNPDKHIHIRSLATEYRVTDIYRAFDDTKFGKNIKTLLTP